MKKKKITEKTHQPLIQSWYKARFDDLEDLRLFVATLLGDYEHDYGTICHALAAAALATLRTLDADPEQGGITGMQASAVRNLFVQKWSGNEHPHAVHDFGDMLFPAYEKRFTSISQDTWKWLQERAAALLADRDTSAKANVAHWESIVAGKVPFGYTVRPDAG